MFFHRISALEAISGEIFTCIQALNFPAIMFFHRILALDAISGEISTCIQALHSPAIMFFHRISAQKVISGEISTCIHALNFPAIKFFHRISALDAISGEIPANHASKVAITVISRYSLHSQDSLASLACRIRVCFSRQIPVRIRAHPRGAFNSVGACTPTELKLLFLADLIPLIRSVLIHVPYLPKH